MTILTVLYDILQWTWGFPQTLVGACFFLFNIKSPHYYYHGAVVTAWKSKSSVSLGMFVFVSDDPMFYYNSQRGRFSDDSFFKMLTVHEYGHTVQSLMFGPLYLLLVGAPSILWSSLPAFAKKRRDKKISYYSVYPERWANHLGEKVTGDKSVGEPIC